MTLTDTQSGADREAMDVDALIIGAGFSGLYMLHRLRDHLGLSARVGYDTLPRVNSLADDVRSAVRSVDRAADTFSTAPNSVLFGAPRAAPGPGEPGFVWPAASAASK